MVMNAKWRQFVDQLHTGFFGNLPNSRIAEIFSGLDAPCGNLRTCFRLISVFEYQEVPSALDVDHDSLTTLHLNRVGTDEFWYPCRTRARRIRERGELSGLRQSNFGG